MADLSGFNANEVEPNQPFEVLPRGEYKCVIIASEIKPTRDGKGKYLQLELQVAAGEYVNRKLFDRLNIWNANEKAVAIAKGTLSAICRAVGVLQPKCSSELHMKPLLVSVNVSEREYEGEKRQQNEVKGYKPIGAGPVPQSAPASAPVGNGAPVPAGGAKQPW